MATTAMQPLKPGPAPTREELELARKTVANGATDAEFKLFLYDCARQGVHPLDRLIYFTKRGGKYTPVTSIDFMRQRAADTGEMAGSDRAVYEGQVGAPNFIARVTVYRLTQGLRFAYEGEAYWTEFKPIDDFMWKKMPHVMLSKCAEAAALRKAFPKQLAGLKTAEEMEQADSDHAAPTDPPPPAPPPPPPPARPGSTQFADVVIDTATGEETSAFKRVPPPPGYQYIAAVMPGEEHEFFFDDPAGGGRVRRRSKDPAIIAVAMEAYQRGIPVRITCKRINGQTHLTKVEPWQPGQSAATTPPPPASEIPFSREPGSDDQ
jgi:phage recombination protein Bet